MGYLAGFRFRHPRPRVYTGFYRSLNLKSPSNPLRLYCSVTSPPEPSPESPSAIDPVPKPVSEVHEPVGSGNAESVAVKEEPVKKDRILRGRSPPRHFFLFPSDHRPDPRRQIPRQATRLEAKVLRMMIGRSWTTRLQNSIRKTVPEFDSHLVYNVIMGIHNVDQSLAFFRWVEMSRLFKHDREIHYLMLQRLGGVAMLNHARCIFQDMPMKGIPYDEELFIVMIENYGKHGIVQESVKYFDMMKRVGVKRTGRAYGVLFKVILRRGRYMMAKRYFNKMLEEGVTPGKCTYNTLLWGFFLSKRIPTAERFYADMIGRGLVPDIVTYNTMINGYFRNKETEKAEKFFAEMKEKNISPDEITYNTLIKGYVSAGKVDDALRMYDEMGQAGFEHNSVTFSTILPGLCDAMKMAEANKILKDMVGRQVMPKDNSIFEKLMESQVRSGDMDAAADVLKVMIRLQVPTEAGHYGLLIENLCKSNLYKRAANWVDKLVETEVILKLPTTLDMKDTAYNPIIEHLCREGQTRRAEQLFRQLLKTGVHDQVAFNNLVRGYSKEGNPEIAFELLDIMIKRRVPADADTFVGLIYSFIKKGEMVDTKSVFDRMIEGGHLPDSNLFRAVMENLLTDERIQTASRVMMVMLEKGIVEHMDLAEKILEGLFLRGHVEEALGRIDLLLRSGYSPDIDNLLSVLSEKALIPTALKLLAHAFESDITVGSATCDKLLVALLNSGRTLSAYSLFWKIHLKIGVTGMEAPKDLIKNLIAQGNTRQADIVSRICSGEGRDNKSGKSKGKKQKIKALEAL